MSILAFLFRRFRRLTPPVARLLMLVAVVLTVRSASAQMFDEIDTSGWFLRAGGVAKYNVRATLTVVPPANLGPGVYENGFVLPDIGGSTLKTWNWGYDSANQIVGDQLVLTRLDGSPVPGKRNFDLSEPIPGAEIIGGYRFNDLRLGRFPVRFGIEVGYGYSRFSGDVNSADARVATRTTDTFGLGGIIPPTAPYAGTFAGPGPLINLQPSHTAVDSFASASIRGSLETGLHDFRFGPYFEIDLLPRLSMALGVGYTSVFTDATLHYEESITGLPQLPPVQNSATTASSTFHTGVYAEVRLTYQITQLLGVYLGGDVKSYQNHNFGDSRHQVTINLGQTYAAKAGINFRF